MNDKAAINNSTAAAQNDVPVLGQKQSPIRWTIMILLPFVVFFVSMFLGRYDVSPAEVVKIFANWLFGCNFEQTWTDSAQKVIIQVRYQKPVTKILQQRLGPVVAHFVTGVPAEANGFIALIAIHQGI